MQSVMRSCVMLCFRSFFFFKQKTAYEMRISDWSSDVCSSDLSDFIFAVAGEEMGLIACLIILGLFAFVVLRGFSRLLGENSLFVMLAASGLLEIGRASCRERVCQYV